MQKSDLLNSISIVRRFLHIYFFYNSLDIHTLPWNLLLEIYLEGWIECVNIKIENRIAVTSEVVMFHPPSNI